MAKILYISLNGMTESLGESQVVQYLLELAKQNSIHLLSFEKPADKAKFEPMKQRLNNANIHWQYFEYSNRLGLLSSFMQMTLAFYSLAKLIQKEKIQIIHARSIIPAVIGMLLKKIFRVKLLFDIRGFAIDEKIMEGRLKEPSRLTALIKKLELAVYKNSDHIVTLTHASKPLIEEKYYVRPQDISIIPTCANIDLFKHVKPEDKLMLKKRIGFAEQDTIVLRNGSINASYDLDAEFKLFKQLIDTSPNVKLLFLNKGQHALIEDTLDKYQIKKERCKIFAVDFHQVSNYINIADVCIFFVKPTFAKQASAPTKFAELVSCHAFTVSNMHYGDMEYYISSYKVGILLELAEVHATPQEAAKKVIDFLEIYRNIKDVNHDFDHLFQNHFSKQIAIEKYQHIYSTLAE